MSTVSVVIPTYNYGRFLAEAIESALSQTRAPSEIIVVDDGSTDDTASIVKGFDAHVKYIKQENAGVCAARNHGVRESTGELIAFLDADDRFEPTAIEKQAAIFESDPEVGLVYCGVREFDSDTGATLKTYVEGAGDGLATNLLLWDGPVIAAPGLIVVSRIAFDTVGGFDPQMKVGEDWDFCYRVARKFRVGFVPEILVNYRIHSAAAHHNVREMERGMSRFYAKAFATDDPSVLKLRKRAFGNYHRILSGSYFVSGEYGRFASHAFRSVLIQPDNIGYFLRFPLRRFARSARSNGGDQ